MTRMSLLGVVGAGALGSTACAAIVPIGAMDRGFYSQAGVHSPSNDSYFAGFNGQEFRNWFVFDVTGFQAGPWVSATLVLDGRFFFSNQMSEVFQVTSVTASPSTLIGGAGGPGVFGALGTGTLYGTLTRTTPNSGPPTVSIPLSAAFLSAVASSSGQIGLGGRLTTLDPSGTMFGSSSTQEGGFTPLLLLDDGISPVPLPTAAGLGLALLLGVGAVRRRRD